MSSIGVFYSKIKTLCDQKEEKNRQMVKRRGRRKETLLKQVEKNDKPLTSLRRFLLLHLQSYSRKRQSATSIGDVRLSISKNRLRYTSEN